MAVHLLPHHCDPLIGKDWVSEEGPIVYAGLTRFIESGLDRIRRACEMVGRPFPS